LSKSKIKNARDLKNFEYTEWVECDSTGWHLSSEAPEKVKKQFEKYLKQIDEEKKEVYFERGYDSKKRFSSYWYQIEEVRKLNPKSVLDIGIGNSFTSKYLKERGFNITTLDHNPCLNPDIVGSVLDIPFKNDAFKVVTCYELLEHMPFNVFCTALKEIKRVAKKYTILSIPDSNKIYAFYMHFPKLGVIKKTIELPLPNFLKPDMSEPNYVRGHYWEIGKKGYPLKKIKKVIRDVGFNIERTYRPFEVPNHRFFVLKA